jgi:hypothetical protein
MSESLDLNIVDDRWMSITNVVDLADMQKENEYIVSFDGKYNKYVRMLNDICLVVLGYSRNDEGNVYEIDIVSPYYIEADDLFRSCHGIIDISEEYGYACMNKGVYDNSQVITFAMMYNECDNDVLFEDLRYILYIKLVELFDDIEPDDCKHNGDVILP